MEFLVGVIIPVFNRSEKLFRAVESVLSSGDVNFQLLVVDDASTEDLSPLQDFVKSRGQRWIRLETNEGPAGARNRGVAELEADWICFLDSDDYWFPEKLSAHIEWHQSNPEYRISQVEEQWFRQGGVVKKPAHWKQQGGELFEASIQRCSIGPSCVMIRRDLWQECGGFDPRFRVCEDYELWLRIALGEKIGLVPGGPLVCKEGGHSDQLSLTVPAMDRYRVCALLKLLHTGKLDSRQTDMVREGIRSKSTILAQGAEKRGNTSATVFYTALSQDEIGDPASWLVEAWKQCEN